MNSFDLLRLAAALLVIFHHTRVLQGLSSITWGASDLGELGVGVFFVISGYLITASYDRSASLKDYLVKRVLRIEPALVVCLAVTALVFGAASTTLSFGDYFASPGVWLYMLRNALLYPVTYELPGVFAHNPFTAAVNGSLWTLRLEFTCYLAVAALGSAGLLRRDAVAALAIGALATFATLDWLRHDLAQSGVLRLRTWRRSTASCFWRDPSSSCSDGRPRAGRCSRRGSCSRRSGSWACRRSRLRRANCAGRGCRATSPMVFISTPFPYSRC
jgi:peptidoglycan/LPS O-acetylase OafA/YrhL